MITLGPGFLPLFVLCVFPSPTVSPFLCGSTWSWASCLIPAQLSFISSSTPPLSLQNLSSSLLSSPDRPFTKPAAQHSFVHLNLLRPQPARTFGSPQPATSPQLQLSSNKPFCLLPAFCCLCSAFWFRKKQIITSQNLL